MIKIALIGCGRISRVHIESIHQLDRLQLVALAEIDRDKHPALKEKWGVPVYDNHRTLLESEEIDVVVIATPNGSHFEIARDVIKAGKHVLLEKPITIHNRDADRLIELAREYGVHLFAIKQVRYNPTIRLLKHVVDQNLLGKIFSASLVVRWTRPQSYYDTSDWRGKIDQDGGTLLNQGIHYVDIMQWILGMPRSVFAITRTACHDLEIEDMATALIKFDNTVATLEFTVNTYPHNLECSLTVLGETGSIKLSGSAMNTIEIWEVKNFPKPPIQEGLAPNIYAGGLYQGSCPNHIFVYEDLLDAFENPNHAYIDGKEARKSLYIVNAIYESAKVGVEVTVSCPE